MNEELGRILSTKDALLMRSAILYQLTHKADLLISRWKWENGNPPTPRVAIADLIKCVNFSRIVVWRRSLWNTAIRKADEAFPNALFEIEKSGSRNGDNLWLFHGVHSDALDGWFPWKAVFDAILIQWDSDRIWAHCFASPADDSDYSIEKNHSHHIRTIGPISNGSSIHAIWSSICAAFYFLGLKLVSLEPMRMHNKSQIRRLKKTEQKIPEIRIVTLRKREIRDRPSEVGEREWQHQWIVSGHWRKQWYPSKQVHEPLFIEPYIKGPNDKPFLQHDEILHRAVR